MYLFSELFPTEHDIDIDTHCTCIDSRCQKESDAESAQAKQGEKAEQVRIETEL